MDDSIIPFRSQQEGTQHATTGTNGKHHDADGDTQQLKYQLQRPGRDLKAVLIIEKEDFVATKNDYNDLLLHNFNFSINNRNRAS